MEIIKLEQPSSVVLSQAIAQMDAAIAALMKSTDPADAQELGKLATQRAQAVKAMNNAQRAEARDAAKARDDEYSDEEIRAAIEEEIRAFLAQNDYRYVLADNTFWLHHAGSWTPVTEAALGNHDTRLRDRSFYEAFMKVLKADGRWFRAQTMTFADVDPDTMNRLCWSFLQPLADRPHHWVFDALIESLTGGKAENVEHLEKVIVAKWRRPSNYLLPTISISDSGGTGKSLFAEVVLPAIFGRNLVAPNLSMGDLTGQFTSHAVGKAVLFVNESVHDRYDDNALKRILGSKTTRLERKGKDAIEVDHTALVFVVGNGVQGAVRLSGSDIDRRFSVMTNNRPLREVLADRMGTTPDQAKRWLETEGQAILKDTDEVARWLHTISERHPEQYVPALHGADYHSILGTQKDLGLEVIEAFLNDRKMAPLGSYVNRSLIADAYLAEAKRQGLRTSWSRKRFIATLEAWVAKEPDLRVVKTNWRKGGQLSTANVVARGQVSGTLQCNDDRWRSHDEFGRVEWAVELP